MTEDNINKNNQINIETNPLFTFMYSNVSKCNVICGINWDILPECSNKESNEQTAKALFVTSPVLWLNKKFLKETAEKYAQKYSFTLTSQDKWKFCCSRVGTHCNRSKGVRNCTSSLKVKCNWHFRISSSVKIKNDNKKSKDDFSDDSRVYINHKSEKTPIFKHNEPCNPTPKQLIYTNRVSGKYVSQMTEHTLFTIMNLMSKSASVPSATIKTIIQPSFPLRKYISHTEIFNVKAKCLKMIHEKNCNQVDYDNFIQMYTPIEIKKGLDFESVSKDEAINHSKAIWEELFYSNNYDDNNSSFTRLNEYLELTKKM
jgi:hypothetical protein